MYGVVLLVSPCWHAVYRVLIYVLTFHVHLSVPFPLSSTLRDYVE